MCRGLVLATLWWASQVVAHVGVKDVEWASCVKGGEADCTIHPHAETHAAIYPLFPQRTFAMDGVLARYVRAYNGRPRCSRGVYICFRVIKGSQFPITSTSPSPTYDMRV